MLTTPPRVSFGILVPVFGLSEFQALRLSGFQADCRKFFIIISGMIHFVNRSGEKISDKQIFKMVYYFNGIFPDVLFNYLKCFSDGLRCSVRPA